MEVKKKGKKRPIPSWMKAMSSLNEQTAGSSHSQPLPAKSSKQSPVLEHGENQSIVGADDSAKKCVPDAVERVSETCFVTKYSGARSELSAADFISQSMPFLQFEGSIVYSNQYSDCSCICEDILSSLSEKTKTVVGFDMEWPVTYAKGATNKTSLIQMCIDKTCYLFHVSAMHSLPNMLGKVITDKRLILTGVNIEADLWKLARDFDVQVKPLFDRGSVIDLGNLANKKLKSSERWSLEGLCRNVLRKRLSKDSMIRCGNWDEVPLQKAQQTYAANDAYAGWRLYFELTGRQN